MIKEILHQYFVFTCCKNELERMIFQILQNFPSFFFRPSTAIDIIANVQNIFTKMFCMVSPFQLKLKVTCTSFKYESSQWTCQLTNCHGVKKWYVVTTSNILNLKSKTFHSLNFSKVCSWVGSILNTANSIFKSMPSISFQTVFYLFANRFYSVLVTPHYLTMYFKCVQFVCHIFCFITDLTFETPRKF